MTSLVDEARTHIAHDHARDEILDQAQRFAEALAHDLSAERHTVGVELQAIVGELK